MSVQEFIVAITEEKNGFILDEPWRINEESLSVIVPIKRDADEERDYITFAEAQDIKVEDTGQIDYVYVQNNEEKPLLISRGEIFRGKTQERAAIHGHIVMPGKGMRVNVRCIHHSKGINRGSEMKYGGRTPYDVDLSSQATAWNSIHVHNQSYCSNLNRECSDARFKSQFSSSIGDMGSSPVAMASLSMEDDTVGYSKSLDDQGPIHASDDLVNTLDDMSDSIKEAMRKLPPIENQVGAIFLYENKVKGMDVYNLQDSWKCVKEDVVAKEGSDYLKKEEANIFEFKSDKVKALVGKEFSCKFEEKIIYGETQGQSYKIIEIREVKDDPKYKGKKLVGEAVEFLDKIIHLTMFLV